MKTQTLTRVLYPNDHTTEGVKNGQLDFWLWEQIFNEEFDGNRRKRVLVKIIVE
jgi:thiamine phosphate synthase YjbQ (UPF0047 family)